MSFEIIYLPSIVAKLRSLSVAFEFVRKLKLNNKKLYQQALIQTLKIWFGKLNQ